MLLFLPTVQIEFPEIIFCVPDENLIFTKFKSKIIRNYQSIQELYSTQKMFVRKIMDSWVGSDDWSPNFVNFWRNSGKTLPTPLLNYLQNEMSIII